MKVPISSWPSVPDDCEATVQGGGRTLDAVKNLWVQTDRHWNMPLARFNARMLSGKAVLTMLFRDLEEVNGAQRN